MEGKDLKIVFLEAGRGYGRGSKELIVGKRNADPAQNSIFLGQIEDPQTEVVILQNNSTHDDIRAELTLMQALFEDVQAMNDSIRIKSFIHCTFNSIADFGKNFQNELEKKFIEYTRRYGSVPKGSYPLFPALKESLLHTLHSLSRMAKQDEIHFYLKYDRDKSLALGEFYPLYWHEDSFFDSEITCVENWSQQGTLYPFAETALAADGNEIAYCGHGGSGISIHKKEVLHSALMTAEGRIGAVTRFIPKPT